MSMMAPITSAADLPAAVERANNHPAERWYVGKMCHVYGKDDLIPGDWGEAITAARLPKLGTGKRFANLKKSLSGRGIRNPGALAAFIGRKKFGAKRFAKLGARARTASGALLAAGAPTSDWLRGVREVITSAGVDPEVLESTVGGGFATAYDEQTDPMEFAAKLIDDLYEQIKAEHPDLDEYLDLVGDGDDEDQGDGEGDDGVEGEGGDETQAPTDQAAAPSTMPVPAMAASGQVFNIGYGDPALLAAALRPMVDASVKAGLRAAGYGSPDDEDEPLFGGDDPGAPPVDAEDAAEGPEGDNADGMPDAEDIAEGPEGAVVPDVGNDTPGLEGDQLDEAKNRLRASFAAAAPPPRRPSLNPPPVAAPGGLPAPSVPPPAAGPVGRPSINPPPVGRTPVPPRRRPVMASGDMDARLAARAEGKAEAPAEGALTAGFRFRHGWIPIGGDRKAAEEAGAEAERASNNAIGEMTHSRAATAHYAASRAYAKAGNEERAAHHHQMALHHSKEAAKAFHYAEDEPDLTKPEYDSAFGRPLRSNMHDDDDYRSGWQPWMSSAALVAAMDATIADHLRSPGKAEAPAAPLTAAGAITAGHPHPGQKYRHGWIPVGGNVVEYHGHMGVDRGDMPQLSGTVNGQYRPSREMTPKFLDDLRAEGVKVTPKHVRAEDLHPTQTTGDSSKIRAMADRFKSGSDQAKPIVISSDNRVLDGHHNWAAQLLADQETGKRTPMPVHQVDLPMSQLLKRAHTFGAKYGLKSRKTGEFSNPAFAADTVASSAAIEAITAGHPYPGQRYKHGWIPVAGFNPKAYRQRGSTRHARGVEIGHRGESGVTHIGSVKRHESGRGYVAHHSYGGKTTTSKHRTEGEARSAIIRGHEKHAGVQAHRDETQRSQQAHLRAAEIAHGTRKVSPSSADIHAATEQWKRENPGQKVAGHEREINRLAQAHADRKYVNTGQTGVTAEERGAHTERVKESMAKAEQFKRDTVARLAQEKAGGAPAEASAGHPSHPVGTRVRVTRSPDRSTLGQYGTVTEVRTRKPTGTKVHTVKLDNGHETSADHGMLTPVSAAEHEEARALTPPATRGALRISKATYQGRDGYSVTGRDTKGRKVSTWTPDLAEAQQARDNIAAGKPAFAHRQTGDDLSVYSRDRLEHLAGREGPQRDAAQAEIARRNEALGGEPYKPAHKPDAEQSHRQAMRTIHESQRERGQRAVEQYQREHPNQAPDAPELPDPRFQHALNLDALEVRKGPRGYRVHHKDSGLAVGEAYPTKRAADAFRRDLADTEHDFSRTPKEIAADVGLRQHLSDVYAKHYQAAQDTKAEAAQVARAKQRLGNGPPVNNPSKPGDLAVFSKKERDYRIGGPMTERESHTPGVVTHVGKDGRPLAIRTAGGHLVTREPGMESRTVPQDQMDVPGFMSHVKASNRYTPGSEHVKDDYGSLPDVVNAAKGFRKRPDEPKPAEQFGGPKGYHVQQDMIESAPGHMEPAGSFHAVSPSGEHMGRGSKTEKAAAKVAQGHADREAAAETERQRIRGERAAREQEQAALHERLQRPLPKQRDLTQHELNLTQKAIAVRHGNESFVSDADAREIADGDPETYGAQAQQTMRDLLNRRGYQEAESRLAGQSPEQLAAAAPRIEQGLGSFDPDKAAGIRRYLAERLGKQQEMNRAGLGGESLANKANAG